MMIGQYNYNLDPKKRLTIPTKFRGDLSDGAILTKGVDGCLFLYPKKQWEELAEKISTQPYITQSNVRSISREIIAQAIDVGLDSLGRILIPDYLKEHAKLERKTVIVGLYNRAEIWDEEEWKKYNEKNETKMNKKKKKQRIKLT